MNTTFSTKMY